MNPDEATSESKLKYTGIKLTHLDDWLWFYNENIAEADGAFVGKAGWARGGNMVEISVPCDMIEARIFSDTLLHND